MLDRDVQPWKQPVPKPPSARESGTTTEVKFVHEENAPFPIVLADDKSIAASALQLLKEFSPKFSTPLVEMVSNFEHPLNVLSGMTFISAGSVTLVRAEHLTKHCTPIDWIVSGMMMVFTAVCANAPSPITFAEDKSRDANTLHP